MTEDKQPYIAIQQMNIDDIIPYDRNPRKNDHAIDKISAAIREYGFKVPIIVKSDGTIIDGHLRYKAAKKLGFKTLPVLIADDLTETQIKAFRISINRMADLADWDNELLKLEIQDLKDADFDVDLTGFADVEIDNMDFDLSEEKEDEKGLSENYTRKIVAPIYEITGKKPEINELYDEEKTKKLKFNIEKAAIPEDIKKFLMVAADRHTKFNFKNIAEFYAHADEKTQYLMEQSALIIIDFDRAVEEGFVKLTSAAGQQHKKENP